MVLGKKQKQLKYFIIFISARLSLVNMIQDVAQKVGNMDVDVVTESLGKAGYRITSDAYMKAGMGDGGSFTYVIILH